MRRWCMLTFCLLGTSTAHGQNGTSGAERMGADVDSIRIRTHLWALAHDSMEGRGPGTRGGRRAGDYIASQFKALGLTPAGDSGTFFHHFRYSTTRNISSSIRISGDSLRYGTDQLVTTHGSIADATTRGEAVFLGYGISTPEWDDYKGASVEGKIAIVLVGLPTGASAGLPASAGTRSDKARTAAAHGARMTLAIHREDLADLTWNDIQEYWREEHAANMSSDSPDKVPLASGFLSSSGGTRLLREGGYSLDQAITMANTGPTGPISLPVMLEIQVKNRVRTTDGRNVVGRLEGSGSTGEYVVIGGHYDAYGIGPAVGGDSIYNGAEDNAAGTAQVLALAEGFSRSTTRPRRSILFVGFDAEEPGLIGSAAFVARPPVPMSSQVAMINLDAANLYGATRDAAALGLKESTLDESFRRAAQAEGMIVPAEQPDSIEAFFLRSDQLPFARAGVPAIFVFVGWDFVGRSPEWASRMWSNYFENHYHRPSDQLQENFSMAGALQQARVVARVALEVANSPDRPRWRENSRFFRR
jgi:Zn-dependent M28 family amino/carboxypeptidase